MRKISNLLVVVGSTVKIATTSGQAILGWIVGIEDERLVVESSGYPAGEQHVVDYSDIDTLAVNTWGGTDTFLVVMFSAFVVVLYGAYQIGQGLSGLN